MKVLMNFNTSKATWFVSVYLGLTPSTLVSSPSFFGAAPYSLHLYLEGVSWKDFAFSVTPT